MADERTTNTGEKPGEGRIANFRRVSVACFKASFWFLLLFYTVYFIVVPARVLVTRLSEPLGASMDLLLGVGVVLVFAVGIKTAHTRFGSLMPLLGLASWGFIPCNWIIGEWDKMRLDFVGTYSVMWGVLVVLGAVAVLGLANFLLETVSLRRAGRSVAWGPWFENFRGVAKFKSLSREQKVKVRNGALALAAVCAVLVPAFLPVVSPNVYPVPVEIRPQDYRVKFNFWATTNLSEYSPEAKAEMNEHGVNVDLMFNEFSTAKDIEKLVEWETQLPNITYRIVLWPGKALSNITLRTFEATELLMELEANGTIDQWRGFCYDIEGDPFTYQSSFGSFDQAMGMWDAIFDFIDQKSKERGKTIEMESVSTLKLVFDAPFDGDADLHKEYQYPAFIPERFTLYAPMVYRCWYEGEKPFGSPMDPLDPWSTSFEVYSAVWALEQNLPAEKVGVYLGITNCSCYGRDLPQPERISWGEHTGLSNLIRDVLVCKHFGVKEVTFFLPWTVIENGYSMGGVFETYGNDFLDVMDEYVNGPKAPEKFDIYYNYGDSEGSEAARYDWVYDFSRPLGLAEVAGLVAASVVAASFLPRYLEGRREGARDGAREGVRGGDREGVRGGDREGVGDPGGQE
ncbi:MAG: hypothetical protein ACTSU5_20330 [Promethearchaeota archaeon]